MHALCKVGYLLCTASRITDCTKFIKTKTMAKADVFVPSLTIPLFCSYAILCRHHWQVDRNKIVFQDENRVFQ